MDLRCASCRTRARSPTRFILPTRRSRRKLRAAGLRLPVVPKLIHPYFGNRQKGTAAAEASRLGVHLIWQAPLTSDPAYQAQIIEDLLTKRVDAIAVAPVDDKVLLPFLARAKERRNSGADLQDVDSSNKNDRIAYVGTDNYEAGKIAGARSKAPDGPANLRISNTGVMTGSFLGALEPGQPENGRVRRRISGWQQSRTSGARGEATTNADTALAQAESILKAHPNLTLIFCSTGTGTPQAAKAVKEAGRVRQVTVVGFDALDDTIQAVRDGSVKFIMAQRPYLMGQLAVRYLDDYLHGRPVPDNTDTGATVVTQKNVDSF